MALALLAFLGIALSLVQGRAARAQQEDGGGIRGTLQYTSDDPDQADKVPIEGGEIVVYAATLSEDGEEIVELGDEVGRVTSAADGTFSLALPTPGEYVARLTPESLPEGVQVVREGGDEFLLQLRPNQSRPLLFNLAEEASAAAAQSRDDRRPIVGTRRPLVLRGDQVRRHHRPVRGRALVDLRHDRAGELRPRRDDHARCRVRVVVQRRARHPAAHRRAAGRRCRRDDGRRNGPRAVASAAQARHRARCDDDRVDRLRDLPPLHHPLLLPRSQPPVRRLCGRAGRGCSRSGRST